jgi:hypothetical protein
MDAKQEYGQWEPVDAAAKEICDARDGNRFGKRILAYEPAFQNIKICHWWEADSGRCNFLSDGGNAVFPSHWMPIPKPPVA